jgi:stage V sporulation protein G
VTSVTFSIFNLRAVRTKTVYAFLDAEVEIVGVRFRVSGIQARHAPGGGTSVHLPCYRDVDGSWRAAVDLPDEVRDALSAAVLELLVEEGLAVSRSEPTEVSPNVAADQPGNMTDPIPDRANS